MLVEKLKNYRVLLGSQSSRRQDILKGAGINFILLPKQDIDETYPQDLKAEEIAIFLSKKKSACYRKYLQTEKDILITADTIVWLNGQFLGKPISRDDAIKMLQQLSGKEHFVYTGVSISMLNQEKSFYSETAVTFRNLSLSEIEYYIDHYKPYDKAGSYGVQEWIGYIGIKEIHGSYFNVMGLPIQKLYVELEKML